jgi:predicted N-acetyltransferase YhbS
MTQKQIRLATLRDVPLLGEVERSASKAFFVYPNHGPCDDVVPVELLAEIAASGKLWVAIVADQPVGFVACREMEDILYVHEISVAQVFQKQGIGRRLMETVLEKAALDGYSAVGLTTSRDVIWNMPFYKTLGFYEITGEECPALWGQLQEELKKGANPLTRCAMINPLNSK